MLDKTKLKMRDRNVHWREKQEGVYRKKHPEMQVRQVTKDFLSKKDALKEQCEGVENYKEELLEDLIIKIRGILTGEGEPQIKARRRAK